MDSAGIADASGPSLGTKATLASRAVTELSLLQPRVEGSKLSQSMGMEPRSKLSGTKGKVQGFCGHLP